jgi:hypothetical protein
LAHNELSTTRALELEASAEAARARLIEARRAMTAGVAPDEVRAIDTARDAELDRAQVLRSALQERRASQLQPNRDPRGLDRDGPSLGL